MIRAALPEETLHAYVDDRLAPGERAEVERFLAEHSSAAERVAAYRRQRQLLRETFQEILHEPVPARLSAQAAKSRAMPSWRRVAAALAWMVVGAALGWGVRDQQHPAAATADAQFVHRARLAHTIYTAETRRAVEVSASQEQDMIRWLSKRMNTAVRVPDLRAFGFDALGGRLLPGVDGPACQLMYQSTDGKRLTIYLSRDAGSPQPIRFSDREAVHVVFWSDGTLAFAVSAELQRDELAKIATTIARGARQPG
jgi:anti-sigma factor RsiW